MHRARQGPPTPFSSPLVGGQPNVSVFDSHGTDGPAQAFWAGVYGQGRKRKRENECNNVPLREDRSLDEENEVDEDESHLPAQQKKRKIDLSNGKGQQKQIEKRIEFQFEPVASHQQEIDEYDAEQRRKEKQEKDSYVTFRILGRGAKEVKKRVSGTNCRCGHCNSSINAGDEFVDLKEVCEVFDIDQHDACTLLGLHLEFLSYCRKPTSRGRRNTKPVSRSCLDCVADHNNDIEECLKRENELFNKSVEERVEEEKKKLQNLSPYINRANHAEARVKELSAKVKLLEKRCDFNSKEFVVAFGSHCRKELKQYIDITKNPPKRAKKKAKETESGEKKNERKSSKHISASKVSRTSVGALEEKAKKISLFRVYEEIGKRKGYGKYEKERKSDGRKDCEEHTWHKVRLNRLHCLSSACRLVHVDFLDVLSVLVTLLVEQYANSDALLEILNHLGITGGATFVRDWYTRESEKSSTAPGYKIFDDGRLVIFIFDNNQRQHAKTARSSLSRKFEIRVYTNYGCYKDIAKICDVSRFKLPGVYLSENVSKAKYSAIFTGEDKEKLKIFVKKRYDEITEEVERENKFSKENSDRLDGKGFVEYLKGKFEESEKSCCSFCGKDYSGDASVRSCCSNNLKSKSEKGEEFDNEIRDLVSQLGVLENEVEKIIGGKLQASLSDAQRIKILGVFNRNPGSLRSLEFICNNLLRCVKNAKFKQHVLPMVADGGICGIIYNDWIVNPEKWKHLLPRNGLFHTEKEFVIILLKRLASVDPRFFHILGFTSPKQVGFISGGGDYHKSFDVLVIIFRGLFKEFIHSVDSSRFLDFWDNVFCGIEDVTFSRWYFRYVCAVIFLHDSIRNGYYEGIEAAVRLLLDLLFLNHHNIYQKIVIFEEILRSCLPDELVQILRRMAILLCTTGDKYEAADAVLEFKNLIQKILLGKNPTPIRWKQIGRLQDVLEKIKFMSYNFFAVTHRVRGTSGVDHTLDEKFFQVFLRSSGFIEAEFTFETKKSDGTVFESKDFRDLLDISCGRVQKFLKKSTKCIINKKKLVSLKNECEPVAIKAANADIPDI